MKHQRLAACFLALLLILIVLPSCTGGMPPDGGKPNAGTAPATGVALQTGEIPAKPPGDTTGSQPSSSPSMTVPGQSAPVQSAAVSSAAVQAVASATASAAAVPSEDALIAALIGRYKGVAPKEWDLRVTGVKTRLDTTDKVVALTFDACGGKGGDGYDKKLIDYLIREKVPATLFINSRWIDENRDAFLALSGNSLFEIENHGTTHRPLSVTGKSAYGIAGTTGVDGVIAEVLPCADKIARLTGRKPLLFRSGTDYYDEVAASVVRDLGMQAIGFSLLGDAGATFTAAQIKEACLSAKPGDIVLCHMNHPEKETAAGMMLAVPALRAKGIRFVRLEEYGLK